MTDEEIVKKELISKLRELSRIYKSMLRQEEKRKRDRNKMYLVNRRNYLKVGIARIEAEIEGIRNS